MNEIVKKNGITYGVISGFISVLILTVIYATDVMLFISRWITTLKVTVFIGLAILLIVNTKKQLKGVLDFKDTFKTYFIFACISLLITTLFEMLLFNLIDPSLKATLKDLSIKMVTKFLENFNTPIDKINQEVKNIQENDQFSVLQLAKGYFSYLLMCSVLGLILAAIFKTKNAQQE